MTLADEKYVSFTTFRRNGTPVSSAVWITPYTEGRMGFYTTDGSGKTKRLRHTSRVTLQPCDLRGRVRAGTLPLPATATMVTSGPDFDAVKQGIRRKYGVRGRFMAFAGEKAMKRKGLTYADTVVLVTPDPAAEGGVR